MLIILESEMKGGVKQEMFSDIFWGVISVILLIVLIVFFFNTFKVKTENMNSDMVKIINLIQSAVLILATLAMHSVISYITLRTLIEQLVS